MTPSNCGGDPGQAPAGVSQRIGDAIPAPTEPSIHQPLPIEEGDDDPLSDPELVPGVPLLSESNFA